jgi:hypothetical protein
MIPRKLAELLSFLEQSRNHWHTTWLTMLIYLARLNWEDLSAEWHAQRSWYLMIFLCAELAPSKLNNWYKILYSKFLISAKRSNTWKILNMQITDTNEMLSNQTFWLD